MFDQTPNSSSSQPLNHNQAGQNKANQPPLNNTQSSSTPQPDLNEPEDIFSQTNPAKDKNVQSVKQSHQPVSPASQPAAQPAAEENKSAHTTSADLQAEPALKPAPSVFKKTNSTPPPSAEQTPQAVHSNDYLAGQSKKNFKLIIIIVFVLLIIAASAAFWFFTRRSSSDDRTVIPAENPVNLFDGQSSQVTAEPDKLNGSLSTDQSTEQEQPTALKDSDGDGLTDEEEAALGTSLTSPDTDNDGLFDKEEVKVYKTDPLKADTDGDGYTDGEEVKNNFDPLQADQDKHGARNYQNSQYKFELTLLENMVFEAQQNNIVRFNDNVDQIKLYVYVNNSQPNDLTPDVAYTINEDSQGNLIITHQQSLPDKTPFSTDLSTNAYHAKNGLTYFIRYVATQRAPDHAQKFESILRSFKFIK